MVFEGKTIEECDHRIVQMSLTAVPFLPRLRLFGDDWGSGLSGGSHEPNFVALQELDFGVVEHLLDSADRELANERVVGNLLNRAARQHLTSRARNELTNAPLRGGTLLRSPIPELDLDAHRLEGGSDSVAPIRKNTRFFQSIPNAPPSDVAELTEHIEPATVFLGKAVVCAPRTPE